MNLVESELAKANRRKAAFSIFDLRSSIDSGPRGFSPEDPKLCPSPEVVKLELEI
jgi:hypothetical protein